MALSQSVIDSLKSKFTTVDELKANKAFTGLSEKLQWQALAAYDTPTTTPPEVNTTPPTPITEVPNGWRIVGWRVYDANGAYQGMADSTNSTAQTDTVSPSVTTPKTTPKTTTFNVNQETGIAEGVRLNTEVEKETGSPDYQDTSDARMTEIVNNLDAYFASNPNAFLNEENFKKSFDVENGARTAAQDQLIMDWYNGKKAEIDTVNSNLERYTQLTTMSDQDLMGITDLNDINIINQDPELQARYQKALKNKQMLEFVYWPDYFDEPEPRMDGLDGLPDNIQSEITQASVDYAAGQKELQALQTSMQNTYDDLVKQAEGTGETDQYLRAKANKINASLQKEYNNKAIQVADKLAKYSALNAEAEMYMAEEAQKKQDRAFNLSMFDSMYGSESTEETPVQTKNFGSSKSPNWKQSLDGGKTRQSIDGIWWGGSGWSWGWSWGWGWGSATAASWSKMEDVWYAITQAWVLGRNDRIKAMKSWDLSLLSPKYSDFKAYYNFIKENLMMREFVDLRSKGATFWAMSEWERKAIKEASTALSFDLSDEQYNYQLNKIRTNYNIAAARAWENPYVWDQSFNPTISRIAWNRNITTDSNVEPITEPTQWSDNESWMSTIWDFFNKIFLP